jgi:hypothetical protein
MAEEKRVAEEQVSEAVEETPVLGNINICT